MEMIESSEYNSKYQQLIGSSHPGLFMILLDQSGSMGEHDKAKFASRAVNNVIYEIVQNSIQDGDIKNRCYLGVIGYGKSVYPIVGGNIIEVADRYERIETVVKESRDKEGKLVQTELEKQIWVEPKAEALTPMAEAFEKAYELIEKWILQDDHQSSFPPVIMNITDGRPEFNNLPEEEAKRLTKEAAIKLMNLETSDGKALLFNVHITGTGTSAEIQLPYNTTEMSDPYAKYLFEISSEIPPTLFKQAKDAGLDPKPNARGLVFNAQEETLLKFLIFGSSGSR